MHRHSNKGTIYMRTSCGKAVTHKLFEFPLGLDRYSSKIATVATQ